MYSSPNYISLTSTYLLSNSYLAFHIPTCILELTEFSKTSTPPEIIISHLKLIIVKAIFQCFQTISHLSEPLSSKYFLIFTGSLSSLWSMSSYSPTNPITQRIQVILHSLSTAFKKIIFIRIPSHIDIHGNETVDWACFRKLNPKFYQPPLILHIISANWSSSNGLNIGKNNLYLPTNSRSWSLSPYLGHHPTVCLAVTK